MTVYPQLPPASHITLDIENTGCSITIQQGGYRLQRSYIFIVFSFFMVFPGYEMGLMDWLPLQSRSSPASIGTVFSGLIGLLCLWMLFRTVQPARPQKWLLGSTLLKVDTGIPALRMISTAAPFSQKLQLIFPRRRQLTLHTGQFEPFLEPMKRGGHRLWLLINKNQRIELAPFTHESDRLWLYEILKACPSKTRQGSV